MARRQDTEHETDRWIHAPQNDYFFKTHTHTGCNGEREKWTQSKGGKANQGTKGPKYTFLVFPSRLKKKELTFLSLPSSSMQTLTNPETDTRKISMAAPHPDIPSHSQGLLGSLALKLNQLCKERECV